MARMGRPPKTVKGLANRLPGCQAKIILDALDANEIWTKLLNSDDERIQLDALKYLNDRAFGKATQVLAGNVEHEHRVVFIAAEDV